MEHNIYLSGIYLIRGSWQAASGAINVTLWLRCCLIRVKWYYLFSYKKGDNNNKNSVNRRKLIPANSHTLCVSHTPADLKHQSHACKTISHAWLTILDYLFINHQCKNLTSTSTQNSPVNSAKCWVWVPNNKLTRLHRDFKTSHCDIQQPSEIIRTSSGIFGNVWKSSEHLQ